MPVAVSVTVDDRGVRKMLQEALRKSGDLRRPLGELGLWMIRDAGRRLRARTTHSDDHTGALRGSLTMKPTSDQVTIGSNLAYAAVQQLGHKGIKPRPPHKRLAIPLLPHLRRRNVWPSDLPEDTLHVAGFSKRGNMLLAGPDNELWYVLVQEVTIEPDPYLVFGPQAEDFLRGRLVKHLGLAS